MRYIAKPKKKYSAFSEVSIHRFPPQNNTHTYINEHQKIFLAEYKKIAQAVDWKVYHKAQVVSKGSATVNRQLILESLHYGEPSEILKVKSVLRSIVYRKTQSIPKAVLLTDDYSTGYFHWIADVLPRVIAFQIFCKKNKEWKDTPILIPHSCKVLYCNQMFEMLGIDYQKCCMGIAKGTQIKVDRLLCIGDVVPPHGSGNYRPQLITQLRKYAHTYLKANKIMPNVSQKLRIYISRKDAKYRYLENEDSLVKLLKEYGFDIIQMSDLSFLQQISLCANADVLLSLHGAGLTNMIWMPKNAKVIEIRREGDVHNNCYFSLASALDLKYYYTLASASSTHTQKANFTLDYSHISKVLSQTISRS